MTQISFISGGGSNYIGGSSYVIKVEGINIGFDCGANLEGWNTFCPNLDVVSHLDYLFLSHAHLDHVGAVPILIKKFPGVKIFATPETRALALIIWNQTIFKANHEHVVAPFTIEDIDNAFKQIINIEDKPIELDKGIIVYPIDSGHILGSRSFLIEVDEEFVFFSSDICYTDRSLIKGAPKLSVEKCRLLIRESTYIGEKFEATRQDIKRKLIEEVLKTSDRGGKILIAALSIDRAQDIFSTLKGLFMELGMEIPIYLDGSRRVFSIYRQYLAGAEILDSAIWVRNKWERKKILEDNNPCIVIASSGMMYPGTFSAYWAEHMIYDERNLVLLVSYQDTSSQGFILANAKRGKSIRFNGELVRVNCDVQQLNFSAHMDSSDGEEMEERMNPDTIIYIHGEESKIKKYISEHQDGRKRILPVTGEEVAV